MRAEIISIGTELLLGEITDTNASYLAGQLPPLGIDLYWISQVGDNRMRLIEMLKRAWQRSELILTTGGLGPTEDDLTREAIAEMLGEKLETEPALEHEMREFFARRGREMPLSNIKQAALIPSARPINNIQGTAPGWWVEKNGRTLISMPGPPSEMQRMWREEVLPRLRQVSTGAIIFSKTFKTFGLAEAAVGELVSPLLSSANPTLAIYAKSDGIHLRLTAKATSQKQAEEIMAKSEASIRAILGEYIWGINDDTLEIIIGHLLTEKGLTLGVMESCTGGLLANTITDASGSSAYFKGGLVAYSDEAKIAYGVDSEIIAEYGSISPEVTQAMADAVKVLLGANIGVSVDGAEKIKAKPASIVYIGIDDSRSKRVIKGNYPGSRAQVKRRATTAALFELRKTLTVPDK